MEQIAVVGILAIDPPGEVGEQTVEHAGEELVVAPRPLISASRSYTYSKAQALTGGLTSLKFHSYAGIWPLGWTYAVRSRSSTWHLAKSTSTSDSGAQ